MVEGVKTDVPPSEGGMFIVAEVSKNWRSGEETAPTGTLSRQFEWLINHNWRRGYELHSYTLHQLLTSPESMNETIIAVFRRRRD
jgi:hypothetical protein